jgi:hypothetical protein
VTNGGGGTCGSFLGPSFSQAEIERRLMASGDRFTVLSEDDMIERTAQALANQQVVGRFQGRMEFGPRALSARSILGDPRSPTMQRDLNLKGQISREFSMLDHAELRAQRMKLAFRTGSKWLPTALFMAGLLTMAFPALLACVRLFYVLWDVRAQNPWEAALVVDGWRAQHHLPVYESQETGHATLMYGPSEPFLLGALFRIFPVSKAVPQLLSLGSAITLALFQVAILRPFTSLPYLILAALSFVAIDNRVSCFAEGRPDLLAWLFGFAGLIMLFRDCQQRPSYRYFVGVALIIIGVSFKQPVAMLVLVPPLALLADRRQGITKLGLILSLGPAFCVVLLFLCIYAIAPHVFYYMVTVPSRYPIGLGAWLKGMWRFLFGAVCLWYGLGLTLTRHTLIDEERRRITVWAAVAFVVVLPASALTAAKAGGTVNSFIPAWLALLTLSFLLITDEAGKSYNVHRASLRAGCSFIVAAIILVSTLLPDLNSIPTAEGMVSANRVIQNAQARSKIDTEKYNEVISYAKTLSGVVISPEDPIIELYATGRAGRSIYAEYDALGWPARLPDFLRTDWSQADHIVTLSDWFPRSQYISQLGFEPEWSNGPYAVWRKSSEK